VNSRRVKPAKRVLANDNLYPGDDRLRREKTSVSQEDYLKAIWEMLEEDQTPISARLAEELRVTPPAVTAALKRMTRDGHVRVERTGRIDLTRKGRM